MGINAARSLLNALAIYELLYADNANNIPDKTKLLYGHNYATRNINLTSALL